MKLLALLITILLFNQSYSQSLNDILDTIQIQCKPNLDAKMKYCLSIEEKNGKIGWLNVLGEWIIPPIYSKRSGENMESNSSNSETERKWSEGIWVTNKNGLFGAINYKNEIVIPFKYKSEPTDCKDGIIIVKNNQGLYAYFNKYGKQLCKFQKKSLPEFDNGIATIKTYSADIRENYVPNISNQLIINNQLDTLLKLKNVKFKIMIEKKKYGINALALHPDFLIHADNGVGLGYYGFINRKGLFFTDIKFKINEYRYGENEVFAGDFNSNRLLFPDENEYIDTLGKVVLSFKNNARKCRIYSFNDFNVSSLEYLDSTTFFSSQLLFDQNGKELIYLKSKDHMGINGNFHLDVSNDVIPIFLGSVNKQQYYSNDFKFMFEIIRKDDKYRYQPDIIYPKKLRPDSAFVILKRRLPNQEIYQGDQQIISTSGKPLSSWIPSELKISPLSGNLIYYGNNRIEKGQKLLNFSKEIIYECSNCNITPFENPTNNLRNFNKIGLFKVEYWPETTTQNENNNVTSTNLIYINYKGINLSVLCENFEGDFKFIDNQIENFLPPPPVKFDFKESVLINAYNKLFKY
jgi:hypothetical protein